jgi:hypothetical protein
MAPSREMASVPIRAAGIIGTSKRQPLCAGLPSYSL